MSNASMDGYLYSGTGNTFFLLDSRDQAFSDADQVAQTQCRKHRVDGFLVMERSLVGDIRMRIFNPDGSEPEMCGNGSRCAAHWAHHESGIKSPMKIETLAGLVHAEVRGDVVKVRLTDPTDYRNSIHLQLGGKDWSAYYINTGVPHTVMVTERLEDIPLERWGRKVRTDEQFKPMGTNVSFLKRLSGNRIQTRTYERGVECETQSCGTGSTACALVAARLFSLDSPIQVLTKSGQMLTIHFNAGNGGFTEVYLEGSVEKIKEWKPR